MQYKTSEEKAKVSLFFIIIQSKRSKKDFSAQKQFEQIDYVTEASRIVTELMSGIPENLQAIMENVYLRPLFGLEPKK